MESLDANEIIAIKIIFVFIFIYGFSSLILRIIHFKDTDKRLNIIERKQNKHEAQHQKINENQQNLYDTLTEAYDYQTNYYAVKKGDLSKFLFRKLRLMKDFTDYLYNLDYLNLNNEEVILTIEDVRDKIFSEALKISTSFADNNKSNNSEIFHKTRTSITEVLRDEIQNDKQNRLLKVMKNTVSASTRKSIETYLDLKKEAKNKVENIDKYDFEYFIKNGLLSEAVIELLKLTTPKDHINYELKVILANIMAYEVQKATQQITTEDANISRAKFVKILYDQRKKIDIFTKA